MATKKLKQTAKVWIPQSQDEVSTAIKAVGDVSRELTRLQTAMNDSIATITQDYQPTLDGLKGRLQSLQDGIQVWCEANRDKLTNGGKTKTANLITGNVLWRQRPPSVRIRGEESVLDMLRKLQLSRFIRNKEEVNKEAILSEPKAVAGIAGISVVTGIEDFVIEPFEQEVQ